MNMRIPNHSQGERERDSWPSASGSSGPISLLADVALDGPSRRSTSQEGGGGNGGRPRSDPRAPSLQSTPSSAAAVDRPMYSPDDPRMHHDRSPLSSSSQAGGEAPVMAPTARFYTPVSSYEPQERGLPPISSLSTMNVPFPVPMPANQSTQLAIQLGPLYERKGQPRPRPPSSSNGSVHYSSQSAVASSSSSRQVNNVHTHSYPDGGQRFADPHPAYGPGPVAADNRWYIQRPAPYQGMLPQAHRGSMPNGAHEPSAPGARPPADGGPAPGAAPGATGAAPANSYTQSPPWRGQSLPPEDYVLDMASRQFGFVNYGSGDHHHHRSRSYGGTNPNLPANTNAHANANPNMVSESSTPRNPSPMRHPRNHLPRVLESEHEMHAHPHHLRPEMRSAPRPYPTSRPLVPNARQAPHQPTNKSAKAPAKATSESTSSLMDEEDTDTDTEDSVDDYVPGSQSPSKGKASTQPSSSPIRRNRTSARLRQRDEGAVSEGEQLMDIDDFAPESSAAAVLSSMSARADAALLPEEQEKEDGQPKRRTYVRRDVERRKMQNAQAQKKFRLKKKKIAEDMRAELNDARLKVADLRDEVKRLQDSHHAHTSENIALRSQLAKLQRIIATCESCTAQRREIEEATAKLRTEMAAKLERGDEGMASDGYAEEDELISNGGLEQMN